MTPYSLAFYVHTVTTGTVLGLRPADSPDRVAAVMGTDFAENAFGRRTMVRDYGLAEFHFHRDRGDAPWAGHHFSLQVHRLARRDRTLPGEVLRARYGPFAPRLRFEKLHRLLDRRGVPLVEIPEPAANGPRYRTFWQPGSRTAVSFTTSRDTGGRPGSPPVGEVYRIQAPVTVA
ncbi:MULTISPECIES: hypothetical protein [unclassified Streptomyces]|uniref:hypothetical protein n=1 Tax=unclassified Streptomyces TaxID=2593676 RepID=UPI00093A6561|nr:hypothetical protein [Streptomyces sp. CB02058]OKI97473.1 hypothetical protein AMK10_01135 [Streptomyces sp. CB02058]